jgi:hypothetical protein
MATEKQHTNGYEASDVNVKSLVIITLVSVVVIAVAVIFLWDYFVATKETVYFDQVLAPVSPELLELQAADREALTTYRLLDSTTATYGIPIDRAIDLIILESAGTPQR